MLKSFLFLFTAASLCTTSIAEQKTVTLAGFAFAGNYADAKTRFPHTFKVFERIREQKTTLSRLILARSTEIANPDIIFTPGNMTDLKGSQALMSVLSLTGETVSTTCYSTACKVFVNLRADAMIFDFKTHSLVRNYPLNLNIFDATSGEVPTDERIEGLIQTALTRTDQNGIISQFIDRLRNAKIPAEGAKSLNLQVANVEISPEALVLFPQDMKNNKALSEGVLSDSFSSIFASTMGLPMLPDRFGDAQGQMKLRLETGGGLDVKIPKGDYLFDIKLSKFVKVKVNENELGKNFIVGAYVKVRLYSDINDFINTSIKNGENVEELSTQKNVDDVPAYQDTLRALFIKLAKGLKDPNGEWGSWLLTSVSAKDMPDQIANARKKLNDLN